MRSIIRLFIWILKGVHVFALIGKSGTGKSFRSLLVAQKYGIDCIIDDGLLIKGQKIVAGRSSKKEPTFLGAIKTALFDDRTHRQEIISALEKIRFRGILIIGTSIGMVKKITHRLNLPSPKKIINIEDIATQEEIEEAILARKIDGKHVIPVPAIEVKRNYPQIWYDTVKVFLKRKFLIRFKPKVFEKSIVRPQFGKRGKIAISEAALSQMVLHCIDEFESSISVKKVTVISDTRGYKIDLIVHIPKGVELSSKMYELQKYILDSLERYAGIVVQAVNITVDRIGG